MSLKTPLCAAGALAFAACSSPTEPKPVSALLVQLPVARAQRIAFACNYEICIMNPDGSGLVHLTALGGWNDHPTWSPDGTKIAFRSGAFGSNPHISVMNASGSGLHQLTTDASYNETPAWSPDGTKIAFMSNRDGNFEIYVMDATYGDAKPIIRLTHNASLDAAPAWSPDGTKIAFSSDRAANTGGSTWEIYVMDATYGDSLPIVRLTTNAVNDDRPSWSPDGAKIAFREYRAGNNEICVVKATDGSGLVCLTNDASLDDMPAWARDGSRIAFESNRDGNSHIYVMNADGSGTVRLTTDAYADWDPSWGWAPPIFR